MLTIKEILDYVDEIIGEEARVPRGASHAERALATGIILALEDIKDWIVQRSED